MGVECPVERIGEFLYAGEIGRNGVECAVETKSIEEGSNGEEGVESGVGDGTFRRRSEE